MVVASSFVSEPIIVSDVLQHSEERDTLVSNINLTTVTNAIEAASHVGTNTIGEGFIPNDTDTPNFYSNPSFLGPIPAIHLPGVAVSTVQDVCTSTMTAAVSAKFLVRERIYNHAHSGTEEPFYVGDIGEIERQHRKWANHLPRVSPFYAVKCNPNPVVLARLATLGTGFDCASQKEMEMVLALGVHPSKIIFANPCKPPSHIRFAREKGIHRMTLDNEDEILKIAEIFPEAELVFRILVDDSNSVCRFGIKFGMSMDVAENLLALCLSRGIKVIGLSFHVGSGCMDPEMFTSAILQAKSFFDLASTKYGHVFTFLDIGGGFPGSKITDDHYQGQQSTSGAISFERVANRIRPVIDELFPDFIQVIAEPGRYFASSVFTLCVRVNARRVIDIKDDNGVATKSFMYYVNDGAYGSFNCIIYDHVTVSTPYVIRMNHASKLIEDNLEGLTSSYFPSSVWGPTCDSMDCITRHMMLPELKIGDWMCFDHMGAYTMAASSTFNGFPKSELFYVNSESDFNLADAINVVLP